MAWTQLQLDTLEAAISQGVLEVQYTDKKVRYRSLDEMLKLRDMMRRSLGLVPQSMKVYPKHSKGLGGCDE